MSSLVLSWASSLTTSWKSIEPFYTIPLYAIAFPLPILSAVTSFSTIHFCILLYLSFLVTSTGLQYNTCHSMLQTSHLSISLIFCHFIYFHNCGLLDIHVKAITGDLFGPVTLKCPDMYPIESPQCMPSSSHSVVCWESKSHKICCI
jgi:hypothetical protein